MPGSTRKLPVWLPILVLLIAMSSIQSGASLAKSLFPLVGAPGVTALRLALGTLILIAFFKPWRLRFAKEQRLPLLFYGLSLGGMNYLFYLSIQTVPLGIAVALEFTGHSGGRAVFIPAAGRFYLGRTGCAWALVPAAIRARYVSRRSYRGRVGARRWRLLGCLYSYRPASRRGTWSATVAVGSLIAAIIFVPIGAVQAGDALWHWSILPLGLAVAVLSTALPYSLEMIALTRLPTRTFGTLMSMEPALAAVSGMIFLGETLTGIQILALCAIIAASMGSTLTIRREPQIKQVDVK